MKKNLLSIMLVLTLVFAVTMPVMATGTETATDESKNYATAADFTQPDSYKVKPEPKITYDDNHNITMTYNAATLKTVPQNKDSVDRKVEAAWVGFELTAPSEATKYESEYNGTKSTGDVTGSKVSDFVAVTAKNLKEATTKNKKLVYTIKYTWLKAAATEAVAADDDNEGEKTEEISTQTLNIVIDPKGVELYDGVTEGATDTVLWDVEDYKDNLPKATTPSTTTSKKKDDTPTMGTENVYALAGFVAVVTLAGVVVLNKRK